LKLGLIFRSEIETGTSCLQKIAEQKLKPWARVNQPPMTAPVGRSVHRMGCVFHLPLYPKVNQHSTTVNLFWLLTFDHFCFAANPFPTLTSILYLLTQLPY
jgi:hypothetical protein